MKCVKYILLAVLVSCNLIASITIASDIDPTEIIVRSLIDGIKEDGCGNKSDVHNMMRSTKNSIRNQGYTCFGIRQAERLNNRMKGAKAKQENKQKVSPSNPPSVKADTTCRNNGEHIVCNIWFPKTVINGSEIPAGYRETVMGQ